MKCTICKSEFTLKRRSKKRVNKYCSLECYWESVKGKRPSHLVGYSHSEETKKKIRAIRKVRPSRGHTGCKHSEETKERIRRKKKGVKLTDEHKKKISKSLTKAHESRPEWGFKHPDFTPWNKGVKGLQLSPESQFKKGLIPWNKGMEGFMAGEQNPSWRGGVTPINEKIRKSLKYEEWRSSVFQRDDYTCQHCGEKGGKLHADHIKPFCAFPKLRFKLSNGRTLCKLCHLKTDTWGSKALKYLDNSL